LGSKNTHNCKKFPTKISLNFANENRQEIQGNNFLRCLPFSVCREANKKTLLLSQFKSVFSGNLD
jgi:hypothetical protein